MIPATFSTAMDEVCRELDKRIAGFSPAIREEEVGRIISLEQGVVWAVGLTRVKSEELVILGGAVMGTVFDILPDRIGIVLLGPGEGLKSGDEVVRTGRIPAVPLGMDMIGRIVDPLGKPLDGRPPFAGTEQWPVEREAPPIMQRAPVEKPLQTGLKVVDALIPIGRGQRELILGDRQTGKSAIAVDTIINQRDKDMVCVYCAIGQRSSSVAKVAADLRRYKALDYTVVVAAEGNDQPGLQFIAPYAATTMAEFFMARGRDVLIVYDDLTRHAQAYRQISLLLRRPPGREAFPGDIFYIHSRLLERATHLRPDAGGGSLTALPIVETEAGNISAYIPTNLISITDGQIYLSPDLFQKGILPAVDVGKSVSRVGGKAQLPVYRRVAGDLRLSYSQFQELEAFARFGTRLDERTKKIIKHGQRVREVFKQEQFASLSAGEQIAILLVANKGYFDAVPLENITTVERLIVEKIRATPELENEIVAARQDADLWNRLRALIKDVLQNQDGSIDVIP